MVTLINHHKKKLKFQFHKTEAKLTIWSKLFIDRTFIQIVSSDRELL